MSSTYQLGLVVDRKQLFPLLLKAGQTVDRRHYRTRLLYDPKCDSLLRRTNSR